MINPPSNLKTHLLFASRWPRGITGLLSAISFGALLHERSRSMSRLVAGGVFQKVQRQDLSVTCALSTFTAARCAAAS